MMARRRTGLVLRSALAAGAVLVLLLAAGTSRATSSTTITFEDLDVGTVLTTQYENLGVRFGAVGDFPVDVEAETDCGAPVVQLNTSKVAQVPPCEGPQVAVLGFSHPRKELSVYASTADPHGYWQLLEYDTSGQLLERSDQVLLGSSVTVDRPSPDVGYVALKTVGQPEGYLLFDDLTFDHLGDPLAASGRDFSAVAGDEISAVVAHFVDADPTATVDDYSAAIDWGDGATADGAISAAGDGYDVRAAHVYTREGTYTVTTRISKVNGVGAVATGSAQVSSATAPPPPPSPPPPPAPPPPPPPRATLTARVTPPMRAVTTKLVVFGAARSTGAVRYRWDLNGDGRDDVDCGGSPYLGVRLYRPGQARIRLTAFAADGTRAFAKKSFSVGGPRPPAGVLKTPQAAICARNAAPLLSLTDLGCTDTVVFGLVEAKGCLERVLRRADIPVAERAVVDEYYVERDIPVDVQKLCEQGAQGCTDWLAKNRAFELFVSKRPVHLNGITFTPTGEGSIVLFPAIQRIVSSSASVTLGPITIAKGAIDLPLRPRLAIGKNVSPNVAHLFSFKAQAGLPSIGRFPVVGIADLYLVRNDADRYSTTALRLQLPGEFSLLGPTPSSEVKVRADNARGLILDKLSLSVPEAYLGAIRFTDLRFDYSRSGDAANGCARSWWKAVGNVFLGGTGRDAGFRLAPDPSQNGIAFCDGRFRSAGGALQFGAQIPPPQLFPGLFLDEVNFAIQLDPTLVRGGAVLSAGQVSEAKGTLLTVYPSPAAPYVLSRSDAGKELAPLAGRTFVSTTIALGGVFGFRIPGVGTLPFSNAYFLYSYPDYVAFGGGIRIPSPGLLVYGKVDGELSLRRALFSSHGDVAAEIAGLPPLGVEAWVTSKGVVVCGSGLGLHPGAAYRWGAAWPQIWLVDGCKPSPYWVDVSRGTASAGRATTSLTFSVREGELAKNIRLAGAGGAPQVEVRAPGGESVSTQSRDFASSRTLRVLRQPQGNVTWIGVERGRPGLYTVTLLTGSPRVASLGATRPAPARRIEASVARLRGRWVLRYRVTRRPKERVTFFERGPSTYRQLGAVSGGTGAIRFDPAPGARGLRGIVAQIDVDGLPGPTVVVAHYRAPGAVRAGEPTRVTVRRRGTAIVASWAAVPGAIAYAVVLVQQKGLRRLVRVPAARRSTVFRGVVTSEGGSVGVRALGPLGDWGVARSVGFRATTKEPPAFRPFTQLGRGR